MRTRMRTIDVLMMMLCCTGALVVVADPSIMMMPYTICTPSGYGDPSLTIDGAWANATLAPGTVAAVRLEGMLSAPLSGGSFLLRSSLERDGGAVEVQSLFGPLDRIVALPMDAGAVNVSFAWTLPSAATFLPSDSAMVARLDVLDQAGGAVVCAVIILPVEVPPAAPEVSKKSKALGYACGLGSALFFGTNYLPVKQFDTGDGVFFQWVMCIGLWVVSLVVQLIRGTPFAPYAMVGGMMWAIGNATTVPIIQCIGLGIGLCLWGTGGLVMGWASGRFGLIGVRKQAVTNEGMNVAGMLLCVAAMGVMVSVKTVKAEQEAAQAKIADAVSLQTMQPAMVESYATLVIGQEVQAETKAEVNWTEKLQPGTRRLVGISLALFAGCLYGLNFNPAQSLIDSGTGSTHNVDYVFSHFTGIFLTSTAYMIAYSIYKRNQPQVMGLIVLPGMVSGVMWGMAQTAVFIANEHIGFIGTFPLASCVPGVVATLCAIVFYREIQGAKNFLRLGVVAVTIAIGVMLIAFSLPA